MLIAGGGLVLVLVAVGSFFLIRQLSGANYEKAPGQTAAVDLSELGKESRLIGLPAALPSDGESSRFVRVLNARSSTILAVDDQMSTAKWMAPVPHRNLAPTALDENVDEPAEKRPATEGDRAELEGTPVDCNWKAKALICGDRSINLGDGSMTIGKGGAAGDSEGARGDEQAAPVTDSATEAVPLSVGEDGSLKNANGTAYPEITLESETPTRMIGAGDEEGPWVVSDGTIVAAVDADSVLWKQDLDEAAARATGLGDNRVRPNWAIAEGILVIGKGDGVRGVEVSTGKELWSVKSELDSFTVSGTTLTTMSKGIMGIFDFTDSSGEPTVVAAPTIPVEDPVEPPPQFPGEEAFRNGKLDVPPSCAEFSLNDSRDPNAVDEGEGISESPDNYPVTLKNGKASASPEYPSAELRITDFAMTRLGDKALTAVTFVCFGGGNYVYQSVGIYDQDRALLDSIEFWDSAPGRGKSEDVSGDMPRPALSQVRMTGEYLGVDVLGVGVYGDDACSGCEKSGNAEVLYRWEGDSYAHQDTAYQLPEGVVREPEISEVQKFAEAVSAGDDQIAAKWATQTVMKGLDSELGDGQAKNPPTVRSTQFPKGVKVDHCELLGPIDDKESFASEYYFSNGRTTSSVYSEAGIEPGDTICGVVDPRSDTGDAYYLYLLLRGHSDGHVEVYETGRQFS